MNSSLETMKRIQGELKELTRNPMINFGITVGLFDESNIFEWKCTILGPQDTCYKGGLFFVKIIFPQDYPNTKPEIFFITPIYHLNVKYYTAFDQPLGHICLSTLNDWKPSYKINKVFPEIFYLFSHNNPGSPYDDANYTRRNEFINNRDLFEKKASHFTKKYANPQSKRKEYTTDWDFSYP